MEILNGYLIAYKFLDAIIKIIRNKDEPKKQIIKKYLLSLQYEKGLSSNTIDSYLIDLNRYSDYLKSQYKISNPDQIYMIKQKIPFARAFSILEYYMRKKNKITSMREILKKKQVNTTEFPNIATWVTKWGMEEV